MKTKNSKQTRTVIITLAITTIIVTALIIGVMQLIKGNNSNNPENIKYDVTIGKFYDNGWDSGVVAEIKEGNVPIPVGFEYVSGTKDTGLIIKNKETGKKYVWIPYVANATTEDEIMEDAIVKTIDSMFEGKQAIYTNPDKLAEIQKYGGFYAGIEDINQNSAEGKLYLGDMTLEQYNLADNLIGTQLQDSVSVNGSVMGREEIESIIRFNLSSSASANGSATGGSGKDFSTELLDPSKYITGQTIYIKKGSTVYTGAEFDYQTLKVKDNSKGRKTTEVEAYKFVSERGEYVALSGEKNSGYIFTLKSNTTKEKLKNYEEPEMPEDTGSTEQIHIRKGSTVYTGTEFDYQTLTVVDNSKGRVTTAVESYRLISEKGNYISVRDDENKVYYFTLKENTSRTLADVLEWKDVSGDKKRWVTTSTEIFADVAGTNKIDTISAGGTSFELYEVTRYKSEEWGKVKYNDKTGYIKTFFVTQHDPVAVGIIWEDFIPIVTRYPVKNTQMYKEAKTEEVIKSVPMGLDVVVFRKATIDNVDWAYVKVDGTEGYMLANDLGETNHWTNFPDDTIRYVTEATDLYQAPHQGDEGKVVVKKLTKGDEVEVLKTATLNGTKWVRAIVDGKYGYVDANFLMVSKPNEPETPTTPETPESPAPEETPGEEKEPGTAPAYNGEVITIKPGDVEMKEEEVPEKWKNSVAKVVNGVPIPKGFEVAEFYGKPEETVGLVIKQTNTKEAENHHRICYVWVPVNKKASSIDALGEAKEALNKIYAEQGINSTTSENATETLPEELVNSVKEYGGFYISQGELGFDNNAKLYNRPRGMYETKTTGWYHVDLGNYFRYIPEEDKVITPNINYVAAESSYFGIISDFSVEKMNQVCELLSTDSVTSHLTYGAEWDATMLWLIKQDDQTEINMKETLLKDSSSIGKYSQAMLNAKLINNIWGLGGNLAEVTQETVQGKVVTRGGSYSTLGTETPIASRAAVDEENLRKSKQHGFRNCIYINLPTEKVEGDSELKRLIDSEKEVTEKAKTVTDAEGKSITVPQGFKVTKDAYLIKDGVVIEYQWNNTWGSEQVEKLQYVWIPVDDIKDMYDAETKQGKLYDITRQNITLKKDSEKYTEPVVVTGKDKKAYDASAKILERLSLDKVEDLEKQIQGNFDRMIASVEKYGGFYIARNATKYNFVYPTVVGIKNYQDWYDAYITESNPTNISSGVEIGMIYGCQWDMALRWLREVDKTGKTTNHINEITDGTLEWTMEANADDFRVLRDTKKSSNIYESAATRKSEIPDMNNTYQSRGMMFVK